MQWHKHINSATQKDAQQSSNYMLEFYSGQLSQTGDISDDVQSYEMHRALGDINIDFRD